jgi:phospholipid transport system substrate-binding protein
MEDTMNTCRLMLCALLLLPFVAPAEDADIGAKKIESTVNDVLGIFRAAQGDAETRNKRVLELVTPLFDFQLMAKLALGRNHWPSDKEKQDEFVDAFIDQLIGSYVSKIEGAVNDRISYKSPQVAKDRMKLESTVASGGETFQIIYQLHSKSGPWKIWDVEIEGISIRKTFGRQYAEFLQKKSIDDLIGELRAKSAATSQP